MSFFNDYVINPADITELKRSLAVTKLKTTDKTKYDGYSDYTGLSCFRFTSGDLASVIRKYIYYKPIFESKRYRTTDDETQKRLKSLYDSRNEPCIVLDSFNRLPTDQAVKADMLNAAKANSVHIFIMIKEGVYYDCAFAKYYNVDIINTYPGSADDAATYGVVGLIEISNEEFNKMIKKEK